MSSALASARKRSIPQQSVLSSPSFAPQQQKQVSNIPGQNPNQASGQGQGAQLTLPQIIDIYGRRILQLEKQVEELKNGTQTVASTPVIASPPVIASTPVIASPSVSNQPVIDLSKQFKTLFDEHIKEFAGKEFVPLVSELNSRHDILAQEIVELKNLLLNLQSFTMTTHKKILDIALEPFNSTEPTTGDNILDDANADKYDANDGIKDSSTVEEDDPSDEEILASLEKSLKSIPEEYETSETPVFSFQEKI